ncbi:MAG: hypothetical protein EXR69_15940 [Myxococcales bacterium]|nr:hypothetical protein [Myxococcales bacterium]
MRLALSPCLTLPVLALVMTGCNHTKTTDQTDSTPGSDVDPYEGHDLGSWLSMKALPEGKPAIAYYDRTSDALGYAVGTVAGTTVTWARENVDSYPDDNGLNPGDAGKYASMAVAADGTTWIAYQDTTNGTLKYATRTSGGEWTTGVADSGGGAHSDAGYWASIALDASNNPVISHFDAGKQNLRVARWNGSTFTGDIAVEGSPYVPADTATASIDAQTGEYSKLLIGTDGKEYLAFYDRAHTALMLATGSGSSWSVETVDDSGDVGQWPDLAMDGGTLYISYQDVGNQDLKLAQGTPGSFTTSTLDSADMIGADSAIIASGGVQIVYQDARHNDIMQAKPSSGSYTYAKLNGDAGALGFFNELITIGGTTYAACYDYTARSVWFGSL